MSTVTTALAMPDPPEQPAGATVVAFPATSSVPGSTTTQNSTNRGELVGPVLDAELVPDTAPAAGTGPVVAGPAVLVRRVAGAVAASPQTARARSVVAYRARKAPADVVRLVWFGVRGHWRWAVKAWTWLTYGDLRADARTARAAGDPVARRAAQEMIRADAAARWARLASFTHRATTAGLALAVVTLVLLVVHNTIPPEQRPPWLAGVFTVLAVLWALLPWLLKAVLVGWPVAAVVEGRDRTPGAGWLTRPAREDADSWIDERMISVALAHLGIGPLDRFFKTGAPLTFTIPARVDGDGTACQIRLPLGVTADAVADRRDRLAANLGRAKLEVWPTEGDEAGVLELWVADKGKLGGGAGVWPLLHDGQTDAFDGVPVGRSQRGTVVQAPLFEANWLIGGRPGQGKSAAMRTLLLGAALDPTSELWVFVMGESPDFEPFRPRLGRYHMGMDDTVAEAAVTALQDLLAEMERRGKTLGAQPGRPPKISRKLADNPRLGLHPVVCAVDECHELFMHPTYGKTAAELAVRLIKRGRKYGIILVLATQSPTAESIPKEITRNISCGVAFAVADHVANDGLLGAGKYKAGIRATDLRMKTDRGTSVAVGVTDNVFELLRWFYIPFEDGNDAVSPVVARAVALVAEHGGPRTIPTTTGQPDDGEPAPAVDHLADVHTVLGTDRRVRTQVVLTRLAEHNPAVYEGWSFRDLSAALAAFDVAPVKSDGVMVIRTDDITHALTHRNQHGDVEAGS
jgi:S-DNA-T family DNA segregation ATPase FtsK/SpoIIIE